MVQYSTLRRVLCESRIAQSVVCASGAAQKYPDNLEPSNDTKQPGRKEQRSPRHNRKLKDKVTLILAISQYSR